MFTQKKKKKIHIFIISISNIWTFLLKKEKRKREKGVESRVDLMLLYIVRKWCKYVGGRTLHGKLKMLKSFYGWYEE